MKKYINFLLIILLISCSSDKKEKVEIESFLKQGKIVKFDENKDFLEKDIINIKNIKNLKKVKYDNWTQKNYSLNNSIYPSNININKKKAKSISGNFVKILSYKNKIITIDNKFTVSIYDLDFKKIISKKIYKKKIYKNYDINIDAAIYKNKIYISDTLGNLHCLKTDDLSILWTKKLGVPFRSNLKVYKENVYLINSNSKIFSFDANNGKIKWSFETASKNLKSNNSYQLAINDEKLFFTNDSAEIFCVDLLKENLRWSLVFQAQNFQNIPLIFESSPIVIDNKNLFVSTNFGYTYSINSTTGSVNWAMPFYSTNIFNITDKYLNIFSKNKFSIINKSNGKVLFNKSFFLQNLKKPQFKNMLYGEKNIYLFDQDGYLFSINMKNLDQVKYQKFHKGYKDYIILNNNLFILSENKVIKY